MTPIKPYLFQPTLPAGEAVSTKQPRNLHAPDLSNLSTKLPAEVHAALQTIAEYVSTASPMPGVDLVRTRQSVDSLVAALNASVLQD